MQYYFPPELLSLSAKLYINSEKFSLSYLNIRSAKKNFENPKTFFLKQSLPLDFYVFLKVGSMKVGSMIETVKDYFTSSHNTQLFINVGVLLVKLVKKGDKSMYIHDSLSFKSRRDLDININIESLSIELIWKNSKKHRSLNKLWTSRWWF